MGNMGNWSEQVDKLSTLRLALALAAGQNLLRSLQEATGYSLVPQGGGAEKLLCLPWHLPCPIQTLQPSPRLSASYFTDIHASSSQALLPQMLNYAGAC